jgi:GNAT superfamily N-acetyltransferase
LRAFDFAEAVFDIKPFQTSDASSVWDLHLAAMEGEHANLEDSFFADLRDVFENYVAPGGEFLIGLAGDDFVACGGYIPKSATEIEIKRMRVHPAHQRKGYGRALLKALEENATSRGFDVAHLETTTSQRAALNLYVSAGYRQVGETEVRGFQVLHFSKPLAS